MPGPTLTTKLDRPQLVEWAGTALVVALAAVLRFWNLGRISTLIFDETYYVKDAYTLWQLGFEAAWPPDIDLAFAAGDTSSFLPEAAFVVHPPIGRWLIGLGIAAGGVENAWAWRVSSAVIGTLAVLLLIRVARRLFQSPTIGLIAGLLLAIDGLAIVHSRTGLLDQFLMFFVLAAFWALLRDRQQFRGQLEQWAPIEIMPDGAADGIAAAKAVDIAKAVDAAMVVGPGDGATDVQLEQPRRRQPDWNKARWHSFRWWRSLAGVLLGLAGGVKWSGIYFLAGFGVLTVLWDLWDYRTYARATDTDFTGFCLLPWLRDALVAFVSLVPVAALTYLASWFSWFATPGAWGRNWATENPGSGVTWLPEALRSWVQYHSQMWTFHTSLTESHPYAAGALSWLVQWRPTAFYWATDAELAAIPGCAELEQCAATINSVGNPILWWLGATAILVTIWFGIWFRDWRATAVLSGILFGWAPWLLYPDRTTFTFYAIAFLPWVILALCYVFNIMRDYRWGRIAVTVTLALIVAVSVLFYPIWTGIPIERSTWENLMWLNSWI